MIITMMVRLMAADSKSVTYIYIDLCVCGLGMEGV